MICKNCQYSFKTNFCGNCGQKSNIPKIDFKYLIHDLPDSFFQINQGFLFTIKQLAVRPGKSIKDFLSGKRQIYYKPLAFFLVTSAIYLLLMYSLDRETFTGDAIAGMRDAFSGRDKSFNIILLDWAGKNQTYFTLFFLPLFSLASYLAFMKAGFTYVEHIVMNLYISGFQMIIYLVFGLFLVEENMLLVLPLLVGFIYNIWTFNQIFNYKKIIARNFLVLLTYSIFFIILFILSMIIGFLIVRLK